MLTKPGAEIAGSGKVDLVSASGPEENLQPPFDEGEIMARVSMVFRKDLDFKV